MPESTTVTGLPGPGGVRPSMPTTERHHSSATSGSSAVLAVKRPGGAVGRHGLQRAASSEPGLEALRRPSARSRYSRSSGATTVAPARTQRGGVGAGSPRRELDERGRRGPVLTHHKRGRSQRRGARRGGRQALLLSSTRPEAAGCKSSVKFALWLVRMSGSARTSATARRRCAGRSSSSASAWSSLPFPRSGRRNRGGTTTSRAFLNAAAAVETELEPAGAPRRAARGRARARPDPRRPTLRPADDRPRPAPLRRRGRRRAGPHGPAPASARAPIRARAAWRSSSRSLTVPGRGTVADLLGRLH